MSDNAYAEVVLPVPVDRPFTYRVPPALQHRATVGMRAIVPFQKRIETGTIVGLSDTCTLESVRSIIRSEERV